MNKLTRLIISILIPAAFSSCVMNDSPQLKAAKTCVIVTNFTNQADFQTVGFTAFGNRRTKSEVPGLKNLAEQVLKEEVGRFYRVKAITTQSDARLRNAPDLAKTHGAELIVSAVTHEFYPYGIPRHLSVNGFGVYSGMFRPRHMVACYVGLHIYDAAGKQVGEPDLTKKMTQDVGANLLNFGPRKDSNTSPLDLEDEWKPATYETLTATQRQQLLQAFREQLRVRVRNDLQAMGLK